MSFPQFVIVEKSEGRKGGRKKGGEEGRKEEGQIGGEIERGRVGKTVILFHVPITSLAQNRKKNLLKMTNFS